MSQSNKQFWNTLYSDVLEKGYVSEPRGRKTIALDNVVYVTNELQHFDENPIRSVNPDYVFREFLWFLTGDRFDTRMTKYAPIWKTCVSEDGGINSNYGQYLFANGVTSAFINGLDLLGTDTDSRRCWFPIFQTGHQSFLEHTDYPCTTGMGFTIKDNKLNMNVHMRSQDLWWGAANDQPVCYLIQLLAKAYLEYYHNVRVLIGTITHYVDNLHFYERHWDKAREALHTMDLPRQGVEYINELCQTGFNLYDIKQMFKLVMHERPAYSPLMHRILSVPGSYGYEDENREW